MIASLAKVMPGGRLGQVLAGVLGEDRQDEDEDPETALKQLKNAIAELYLSIKQKTRDEVRPLQTKINLERDGDP